VDGRNVSFPTLMFAVVVMAGLVLPTNSDFYLPLGHIFLKPAELMYLVLPIINALRPRTQPLQSENIRTIQLLAVVSLGMIFFTEFVLKSIVFGQSIADGMRSIQIGLPLLSSMVLVSQGARNGNALIWKAMVVAVGLSAVISVSSMFVDIPIYSFDQTEKSILEVTDGRLVNSNSSFGLIALFAIAQLKNGELPRFRGAYIYFLMSIIALFLTFSRTYIALVPLSIMLVYGKKLFRVRELAKATILLMILATITVSLYRSNERIQAQINQRFLESVSTIVTGSIEGTRDVIWSGALNRIKEGYWVLGLPFQKEIFTHNDTYRGPGGKFPQTDTSVINLLLRYGIVSTIAVIAFLLMLSRDSGRIIRLLLLIFTLASINIDSLVSHNAIFFLVMTELVIRETRRRVSQA
jgi:hypothetical protein